MAANRQQQIITQASAYIAPLPSAEQLIKYKEAHPDAPERIIQMAERQAAHRQKIETKVVNWDVFRSTAGLFCALVVVLAAIYASWSLVSAGHDTAGVAMFGGTLASIVSSFIFGTKKKQLRMSNQ